MCIWTRCSWWAALVRSNPPPLQGWFAAGASAASLLWFSALGFGARWLAPWFARPRAWQVLDALIGVTMWVLSLLLVRHVVNGP